MLIIEDELLDADEERVQNINLVKPRRFEPVEANRLLRLVDVALDVVLVDQLGVLLDYLRLKFFVVVRHVVQILHDHLILWVLEIQKRLQHHFMFELFRALQ